MSDAIKHECGIALVRLLKPISYYCEKYGTALYGFNKLFLLMEKQHNRGQDGAGTEVKHGERTDCQSGRNKSLHFGKMSVKCDIFCRKTSKIVVLRRHGARKRCENCNGVMTHHYRRWVKKQY